MPTQSELQALLREASCFFSCIQPGMENAVIIALLAHLTTIGTGSVQVYVGRNPLPPDDLTAGAISYPAGGGVITQWNPATLTWV